MTAIKVGDKLYVDKRFNRRQSDPLWDEYTIVAETKVSWLVGPGWASRKVNKKTMLAAKDWSGRHDEFFTAEQKNSISFCRMSRPHVIAVIEKLHDEAKMRQIIEILALELK